MLSFIHTLIAHPIIPAFLVANLAIGFWAHRKAKVNSFEDYALASRSLPTGVLVMTLLATFVATAHLGATDTTFKNGILTGFNFGFYVLAFFLIGLLVAPCLVYFNECKTLGDVMCSLYGRSAQIVSGIIGCFVSLLIVSAQVSAIGNISAELLGMDTRTMSILFFGGVAILYSSWGGMRSVSYTDVLQAIGAFLVFGLVTRAVLAKVGGITGAVETLQVNDPDKLSFFGHPQLFYRVKSASFWALSGTFLFTLPLMQRMLIPQDKRQVRKMWYAGGFFYALICFMIIFIGLGALAGQSQFGIKKGTEDLLPNLIRHLYAKNSMMIDVAFICLLGVLISTMDSHLHAVGVSLIKDVVEPVGKLLKLDAIASLSSHTISARIGVFFVGSMATWIGILRQDSLTNRNLYTHAVVVSGILIVPMLIGILGVKTDRISWYSYCTAYIGTTAMLWWLKWHEYDTFLVAVPAGLFAYFLAHIIQNRGIVTLKRSELTVSERLWLPSWSGLKKKVMGFVKAPLHLPTLADRKVVGTPMHSLAFSMLIFALYTLSSIFSTGGEGTANFMAGIHFVGITLCCGLMLQGIWTARLKPYFSLYWFVSLFYCLPFGGALSVLQSHAGVAEASLWVVKIVFLAFLVDSSSFLVIAFLGTALPCLGWHLFTGGLPQDIWSDPMLMAFAVLLAIFLGILLFGRGKEARTNERLYWNRIASSILGHDLRGSTQMLGGAGNILEKTFKIGEPSTNGKGEKGYWLPFAQSEFLAQFSTDMGKKAASTRKDIQNFLSFIQSQIMGTFEQEGVSMRSVVEEGIEQIGAKVKSSRVKIVLEAKKDFEAKVLAGIFPHVIFNLLMNATTHGKASEVTVTIDANTRTVTVRDNGDGIPSDVLPRIFDLSYSSAGQGKENAGVGLAFAKMVLDASGAKIACHSRVGKGSFTEFVMTFEEG